MPAILIEGYIRFRGFSWKHNLISLERDYVEISFSFQAQPFRHTDARRSLVQAKSTT